jgi:hypothetical protein
MRRDRINENASAREASSVLVEPGGIERIRRGLSERTAIGRHPLVEYP